MRSGSGGATLKAGIQMNPWLGKKKIFIYNLKKKNVLTL